MSKKLEIKQIAEELALSSTTVSRALSGKGRVSDATRQRVQEYIKANNAAPAVRRRPYTARKTRNILVTVAGERNYGLLPYFSQVIMGAYDFFQPLGYQVLVAKTSEDDIEPLKKVIKQHKCDGVILSRTLDNALDIRFLQEKGVPFVTPHIVKEIQDNQLDSIYRVPRYTTIEKRHYESVVEGMRGAATGGTCRMLSVMVPDLEACGKTGTAQNRGHDHSVFMGFAPMNKPKIAIAVYVENGGWGATYGVPFGALMMEQYLKGKLSPENELRAEEFSNRVILYGNEER